MIFRILAIIGLMLLSCTKSETAGTTSETENDISVSVAMPDGTPAHEARVWLIDAEHFDSLLSVGKSPVLDSSETDEHGIANLSYEGEAVRVNVMAAAPGLATLSRNYQATDSALTMERAGNLAGTTDAKPGSRVVLEGTGMTAIVDDYGHYVFGDIPQGEYAILVEESGEGLNLSGAVKVDTSAQQMDLDAEGLLLEDFDDGDALPLVNVFGAGAAWYVYRDGTGTLLNPEGMDTAFTLAITANDAFRGKSFGISVSLDSNVNDSYGSIACKIGPNGGKDRADLSALDSVSLWVKGSGQIRIAFASDFIHTQYPASQAFADLGYKVQLPSEWTRIVIPVDSLLPPENSEPWADGVRWNDVSQAIDLLVIGTWDDSGQTVDFQIDEVRLHGISHTIFR